MQSQTLKLTTQADEIDQEAKVVMQDLLAATCQQEELVSDLTVVSQALNKEL